MRPTVPALAPEAPLAPAVDAKFLQSLWDDTIRPTLENRRKAKLLSKTQDARDKDEDAIKYLEPLQTELRQSPDNLPDYLVEQCLGMYKD